MPQSNVTFKIDSECKSDGYARQYKIPNLSFLKRQVMVKPKIMHFGKMFTQENVHLKP